MKEFQNLLHTSSREMNVNGSVTPVAFTYSPGSSTTRYIKAIKFLLLDDVNQDPTDFGAIAGPLANGVLVQIKSNGTTYTFCTLQDNRDIGITSTIEQFYNNTIEFMSANGVDFVYHFDPFVMPVLQDSSSDSVTVTIRDNLTGLNHFRCTLELWYTV